MRWAFRALGDTARATCTTWAPRATVIAHDARRTRRPEEISHSGDARIVESRGREDRRGEHAANYAARRKSANWGGDRGECA